MLGKKSLGERMKEVFSSESFVRMGSDTKTSEVNAMAGLVWTTPAVLCGLAMFGMVLTSVIAVSNVMADDVIDEVTLFVPVSCTLSGVGMDTHTVTLKNGQANSNVGETTIKAYCNDVEGFAIYAIGFTNDADGKNVLTDSTLGSDYDIVTGTATGPVNNVDTSNWAMKVTIITGDNGDGGDTGNGGNTGGGGNSGTETTPTYPITIQNDFDSFHTVPDAYAMVAKRDSGTDVGTGAEGSTLKTTYQIYVSGTQLAGTYSGRVKYILLHPNTVEPPYVPQAVDCDAGKICYNTNAGPTETEGTMAKQSAGNNATVTLYPSNFSREGHGFAGWSDKYDYKTNPEANFYGPMEDITTPSDLSTKGLSLYAVWVESEGSIQDANKVSEVCNRLTQSGPGIPKTLNSVSALTDQRDGDTYAIAKLADGKCWMIENLRLDNTAEHNSDGTLAQGYGTSSTYGNFVGLVDPEFAEISGTYSANTLYSNDGSNNTVNIGTSNYPAYRMPRYNNSNTSTRAANTTTDQNIYSYGNYYTWAAAVADTTYHGLNNADITNTSLCPIGWHLPTGGSASAAGTTTGVNVTGDINTYREFYNLGYTLMSRKKVAYEDYPNEGLAYYGSLKVFNADSDTAAKAFRRFPNNFVRSGSLSGSSFGTRGGYGRYWSSTTSYNDNYSSVLYLHSRDLYPGTSSDYRYIGLSVRCVASS